MERTLIILTVLLGLASCNYTQENIETQVANSDTTEDKYARELLNFVLADSTNQCQHINTNMTDINDQETAIKAVDPILFNGYGRENIIEQKPYKISKIDNYWIIEGIQKEPHPGGVFHLVLDYKDGSIIYLIHGK